jgi:acylphosphatase
MSQQKAILATVTGDDQKVGFRAMVMKQAIEHNLAGIAANQPNMIVSFTLQGDEKRLDKAIAAIGEGTKRSAGADVSASDRRVGFSFKDQACRFFFQGQRKPDPKWLAILGPHRRSRIWSPRFRAGRLSRDGFETMIGTTFV